MSSTQRQHDELYELIDSLCDERLDDAGQERLAALVAGNDEAMWIYVAEMNRHAALAWDWGRAESAECRVMNDTSPESSMGEGGNAAVIHHSAFNAPSSPSAIPPIIIQTLPSPHSTLPSVVGIALLSYSLAAVIVSIGLLVAAAWKLPGYSESARHDTTPTERRQAAASPLQTVGRVTGLVDCQWADPSTEAFTGAYVHVGRRYALHSGVLEITYFSGAKVLLQGPVTYEVESPASGFLLVGKLTARLEKRSAVSGQRSETSNPQSLIPNPLFAIRTPTATVTDLGTEFGVEVHKDGACEVHVLTGAVDLMTRRDERHVRLEADNLQNRATAARVEVDLAGNGGAKIVLLPSEPKRFLRTLPKRPSTPQGPRILVGSRFDLSSEGWSATAPSSQGLIHLSEGGNPGGCVETREGTGPDYFYFIASPKFSGDGSALFGGQLKFDVYTTIFQPIANVPEISVMTESGGPKPPLVVLQGRAQRIAADQRSPVARDRWTTLTVPLSSAGKWYRLGGEGAMEGKQVDRTPVSDDVIREVLSDLREVWIRAEYMHGRDQDRMDNVLFMTPGDGNAEKGEKSRESDAGKGQVEAGKH